MLEPSDSGFFNLQGILFAGISNSMTLRDGQKTLMSELLLHTEANFGVVFHVDRARQLAQAISVEHGKLKSPGQWRLDRPGGKRLLSDGVLRRDGGYLFFSRSVAGANVVLTYPQTDFPMTIVRLEWAREPDHLEDRIAALRRMCRHLGSALKLLEDREAAEHMTEQLVELQETTTGLDEELDDLELDRLLEKILKVARGKAPGEHLCVLLVEEDGLGFAARAYHGDLVFDSETLPRKLLRRSEEGTRSRERRNKPRASGTFFKALDSKKIYLARDVSEDSHYTPLFRGTRSSLAVPILLREEAVAVLVVESNSPNAFGQEHIQALEGLARIAAIHISKARVYQESVWKNPKHPVELLCQPSRLLENTAHMADSDSPILIEGESGTGKGMLAQYIHRMSPRRDHPFVSLNCGTISDSLLLSQLFGHVKGAFTGADQDADGHVALAEKGTLFIDDMEDLSREAQASLLELLSTGEYKRVGNPEPRLADVRVITATNVPLRKLVEEKKFREDLFHRLSVLRLKTIPLRHLLRSIPRLVRHKFQQMAKQKGKKNALSITPATEALLKRYEWPGNFREVNNVVNRLIVMDRTGVIDVEDLPEEIRATARAEDASEANSFEQAQAEFERQYLISLLKKVEGNVMLASKVSEMTRSSLYKKFGKYKIDPAAFRRG